MLHSVRRKSATSRRSDPLRRCPLCSNRASLLIRYCPRCGAASRVLTPITDPDGWSRPFWNTPTRWLLVPRPTRHQRHVPVHGTAAASGALGHPECASVRALSSCHPSQVSLRQCRADCRPPSVPHDSHADVRDTAPRRQSGPLEFLSAENDSLSLNQVGAPGAPRTSVTYLRGRFPILALGSRVGSQSRGPLRSSSQDGSRDLAFICNGVISKPILC